MSTEILVFAEQQSGKITRPTWEAVAAGQKIAADTGGMVTVAVLGAGVSALAPELAAVESSGVLAVESPALAEYTPDGYALALAGVTRSRQPQYVVFSHTYQVRDFAPKLAAALGVGFISDCLGYRNESGKLVFVRQVFQGKFNADVEFTGGPPYLVSFQAGAVREDAVRRGAADEFLPQSCELHRIAGPSSRHRAEPLRKCRLVLYLRRHCACLRPTP